MLCRQHDHQVSSPCNLHKVGSAAAYHTRWLQWACEPCREDPGTLYLMHQCRSQRTHLAQILLTRSPIVIRLVSLLVGRCFRTMTSIYVWSSADDSGVHSHKMRHEVCWPRLVLLLMGYPSPFTFHCHEYNSYLAGLLAAPWWFDVAGLKQTIDYHYIKPYKRYSIENAK